MLAVRKGVKKTLKLIIKFKNIKEIMKRILDRLDRGIIKNMRNVSIPAIRLSFGVIFIWFGILKPLGLSSAEGLLKATVIWLPFGSPDIWLIIIGFWEVVIGIFLIG